jgi:hypothetical protein
MPTFDVQLNVNVPGLGDRNVMQTVMAPTMEEAIQAAKANVIITPLLVRQTAS